MDRPVIPPLTILPTAPETFSVLEQRMRVAEEQTASLISDLQALGVSSHRFTKCEKLKAQHIRPISPVRARTAFIGDGDTLWKNCENLVTRMCHMESMLQTMKLNVFRLHTDRELSTKHSGELEHRLLHMQEEHAQELKESQLEVMRLRQRLNCAIGEREREQEAKDRLSAALEIATTTKTDVTIAVEELKATKACMSQRLAKLQDKLSQEATLRALLEEEQAALLLTVQDMKNIVEEERTQVQELQQYCQKISKEDKDIKDKLEAAESKCQEVEKDNQQLRSEIEAKVSQVSQLQEDIKIIKQKCEEAQAEIAQMRADSVALREAAEKVQVAQDTTGKKLQEQETLLSIVQTSLSGEVQKILNERNQMERELETLRTENTKFKQKAKDTEKENAVEMELQENTIASLRADLDSALQNKTVLENEKMMLQEEFYKTLNDFMEKNQNLEVHLTESKLEQELLQSSLWVQEQENKRLAERVALQEQEQHNKRQVESLLNELTDSKNKLAYEKGKLQSTVQQLQSDLESFGEAHSENSKLCKLNSALQARFTQVNSELDSSKIRLQRLQAKLQKTEHVLLSKEEELALAVQTRDEAKKEERRLRQQIDTFEEMEERNKSVIQQQLSDVCEERARMSETLENVLSSHSKLQKDLETLQTELGQKDNDLLSLHKDRFQNRERFEKLKAELLECNAKLQSAKCQQYREIEPLQKFVEITREDNRKLAQTLNLTLQRNSTLQNLVNELQKELQNKELQEKQLILNQAKAAEDYSLKEKLLGEQLVSLQNKHRVESKEAKKAVRKELTELKKALDSVTAKSTELSRTNRELRNRESMLEKETLHQKDLIHNLKIQLKSHIESQGVRKQSERIQDLEAELKRMKNMKESYEKNNNEQCKRIQEFMTEVDHMRKEINAAASQDAKEPNVQSQLEEEVTYRQKLEQRCKELESRVQKLQQVKSDTEISLRAANEGSEQDLNNLKTSPYFPASAVEHWETKQKLQLISRNLLLEDKTN
ncbi:coiled-coil domain-containing protein 150 isoform X2 [Ranitomeya imitator]|uniref:coiled-coil domain-containing protein 150 isoform X2 n=1 Tax=Ranitomeya imitator TaxID=111125 RepID=UPI0037E7D108